MAIKLIPPDAILEAILPDANMMDNEFPNNLHFLKLFNACLYAQHFYDMSGSKILILQPVLQLVHLKCGSS